MVSYVTVACTSGNSNSHSNVKTKAASTQNYEHIFKELVCDTAPNSSTAIKLAFLLSSAQLRELRNKKGNCLSELFDVFLCANKVQVSDNTYHTMP